MNPLIPGFGLIFLAAVAGGAFAFPLRIQQRYAWENTWLLAFFFALVCIPFTVVSIFLPVWRHAVVAAGPATVLTAVGFGFLWGWGAVTFALGISSIGMSLGYATIMGLSIAIGSIIPMIRRWDRIPDDARFFILLGIATCLAGVAICGRAGVLRERAASALGDAAKGASSPGNTPLKIFLVGLAWCILSGFLSACANLGFDFADRVALEAQQLGAGPLAASIGRWITVYWGGFLAILIGSGSTMLKNGTWRNYFKAGSRRDFGLALVAGCLHFLAQIPYGMGAYYLGRLGTSVGWVFNIALSLLVANAVGFITKEWKGAPKASTRTLFVGLAILVVAMGILAHGNNLVTSK
ncbi:MAG TPA: L-rhamnose/proton symporter RhaT [Terriglobia bacterium]|nr:L-rhamnose/proton symporter RhaT [Terriglobia bacterium]